MAVAALLAVDLGTSACRATLFALTGERLGEGRCTLALHCPAPGAAEQEPADWWQALLHCSAQAATEAPPGVRVQAVGLSVQGHTWVPTDAHFEPLRPALTWLDSRAAPQARQLADHPPVEGWGALTGKLPGPWHLLSQWLWLAQAEPGIRPQARHLLTAHDWLQARLTGSPVTDLTQAATTLLFDLRQACWSPELLDAHGLRGDQLPLVQPAGTVAGRLQAPELRAVVPCATDAIVAVGAQDQKCAALAAGLDDQTATVSLGTAGAVTARLPSPRFAADHGALPCFPYLQPGEWVLEAPLATAGGALRWLKEVLGAGGDLSYDELIAAARPLPPGAEGVRWFPYLAGAGAPHWALEARGGISGLTLHTGPGHLCRALLEAVAGDIAANLDHMQTLGCCPRRLRLFGGGCASDLWPRIIAACCDLPTEACSHREAATQGAAMLAARALQLDPDPWRLHGHPVTVTAAQREAYRAWRPQYSQALTAYWALDQASSTPPEAAP
jgi:xylulokinase